MTTNEELNNQVREYVETVQDAREAHLLVLYKLIDGEITDPDTLDPEEDAEEIAEILEELGGQEWQSPDDAQETLDDFGLALDKKVLVTLTIGTGGPADWIECECSKGQYGLELDRAVYYSQWGSDRRERGLREGSALWRWAESQIEYANYIE